MLLKLNPDYPEKKKLNLIVDCLNNGGIIIYPTDTVYAFGWDATNKEAIQKIRALKGLDSGKVHFSFVFNDLSQVSDYTRKLDNATFKYMKATLPGPYTFILKANKNIPRLFNFNKKTIGIRIPENIIARTIAREFGRPVVSSSIHHDDKILTYMTDPASIFERYKNDVDLVIDGGMGSVHDSTVVDFSAGEPKLLREGKGLLD